MEAAILKFDPFFLSPSLIELQTCGLLCLKGLSDRMMMKQVLRFQMRKIKMAAINMRFSY